MDRKPPLLVEMSNAQIWRVEVHDFHGSARRAVELGPGAILVRSRTRGSSAIAVSQNRQAFDEQVSLRSA